MGHGQTYTQTNSVAWRTEAVVNRLGDLRQSLGIRRGTGRGVVKMNTSFSVVDETALRPEDRSRTAHALAAGNT